MMEIKNKVIGVNNTRSDSLEPLNDLLDEGWVVKYPPLVAEQSSEGYATMVYFVLEKYEEGPDSVGLCAPEMDGDTNGS